MCVHVWKFILNVDEIVCAVSMLVWLHEELFACSAVDNDCRWDCERFQLFIMIFGEFVCVFSSI